ALAAGKATIITDLLHLSGVASLDPRTWTVATTTDDRSPRAESRTTASLADPSAIGYRPSAIGHRPQRSDRHRHRHRRRGPLAAPRHAAARHRPCAPRAPRPRRARVLA